MHWFQDSLINWLNLTQKCVFNHFKFCFMAFGASIEGWKYYRLIISVDRTFLK
uniref:Uncharacterized protein n=1 Tax=Cucumis melo TaxID=3656 RepID=A0A9I9EE19_CUCME